ncbi:MAG: EAL domain-containing protein [Rhodobacteraceae bacterium]|nr:EAL domain-containing protein [Paracoccaceae bacterium]
MGEEAANSGLWMALAAMFVLLMQAGFLLLEAGRTRTRHSISVAQKNISDIVVCWILFSVFGFAIAFGPPAASSVFGDLFGDPTWRWSTHEYGVAFIYQCGFCAAAATIISGAVAERIRFTVYLGLTAAVALLIYPLVARLVWGDLFEVNSTALLGDLGFIDHAGATVVHSVGGWAALAAVIVLGRRSDVQHGAQPQGHSDVLALCGALLLLIGWLGFNAGAETPGSAGFADALVNTLLAGACGAGLGMAVGAGLDRGHTQPPRSINGLVGGLVAVTASASFIDREAAMMIGAVGGLAALWAADMLRRIGLDDPLDAVAVHGVAGAVGTLAVAVVAPMEMLVNGSRFEQFGVQVLGVGVTFVIAFGGAYLFLQAIELFDSIRVTEAQERMGLNASEHGALLGVDKLHHALKQRVDDAAFASAENCVRPLEVEAGEEGADIADTVNLLMARYEDSQSELVEARNRMRDFASCASDFMWETDAGLRLIYLSSRFEELTGHKPFSAIGGGLFELLNVRRAEEALVRLKSKNGDRFDDVIGTVTNSNGDRRLIRLRGAAFFDATGGVAGVRGTGEDITEQAETQERLRRHALHDELTGTLNRRSLHEHVSDLIFEDREHVSFAVVAFDLDGFKAVNDIHGHEAGDRLLMTTANRIQATLREQDILARMGGDEFVAVLSGLTPGTAEQDALDWAHLVISEVERPQTEGPSVSIGLSAGVRVSAGASTPPDQLLQEADQALYHAKRSGRGCAFAYDPSFGQEEARKRALQSALAAGLEAGEFFLEYQPQCCAREGRILGFEALVRWRRPEVGTVPPNVFIPIAEQSTLIHKLGAFVLREAVSTAAEWHRSSAAKDIVVSVNVSPKQLRADDFVPLVVAALEDAGLPPELLELEITESVFIDDAEACIRKLAALRGMGVSIAIDDFGTGFSSLGYLKHLPLNRLKIDKTFIDTVLDDDSSLAIVDSVLRLGKSLGLSVIAEGVESEAQRVKLDTLGCPMFQGFLRSRPVSAEDAEQMILGQSTPVARAAG